MKKKILTNYVTQSIVNIFWLAVSENENVFFLFQSIGVINTSINLKIIWLIITYCIL